MSIGNSDKLPDGTEKNAWETLKFVAQTFGANTKRPTKDRWPR
jgi:hypothetical protein